MNLHVLRKAKTLAFDSKAIALSYCYTVKTIITKAGRARLSEPKNKNASAKRQKAEESLEI